MKTISVAAHPGVSITKLERDILIASKLTDEIHIFCLETSVQKGFLNKIQKLEITREAPDISLEIEKQRKTNGLFRFILFVLNYPLLFTVAILVIITLIIFSIYKLVFFIKGIFTRKHKSVIR